MLRQCRSPFFCNNIGYFQLVSRICYSYMRIGTSQTRMMKIKASQNQRWSAKILWIYSQNWDDQKQNLFTILNLKKNSATKFFLKLDFRLRNEFRCWRTFSSSLYCRYLMRTTLMTDVTDSRFLHFQLKIYKIFIF